MEFLLSEIAVATGGEIHGTDLTVRGAGIDSRSIQAGQLFIPIVAERDGHDFIPDAARNGAVAHLAARRWPGSDGESGIPWIGVDDTGAALQSLGQVARARLKGNVIGVTGSVGKTTTKDLLASALSQSQTTHASHRSFNNELGVPLTLTNAPADSQSVIVEMGARGRGHISQLCGIARPDIGVVLNVGAAHTALFGDIDEVGRAKGELIEALPPSGTAVLNSGDARVLAMAALTDAPVLTFGKGGDVEAHDLQLDDSLRPRFHLTSPWGSHDVRLASAGLHTVVNALAATAAALAAGADLASVVHGLACAQVSPWRMEVGRGRGGALVINDAYNANPMSMNAAIDALLVVPAARRVAVIGVMAELGEESAAEHIAIGRRLAAEGVDVIAVEVEEYGGILVAGAREAVDAVGRLDDDCVVLVKASRVAGLEQVASRLGVVLADGG